MRKRRSTIIGTFLDLARQLLECAARLIGVIEQAEILGVDHAVFDEGVKIDDLLPVARAVKNDRYRAVEFTRLGQCQDLGQLIQGSEAAGKDDECAREVRKPELAHEEVMKFERQRAGDVGVWTLFTR